MKRSIKVIMTLMSLCVAGIIGLQVYWNIQNYRRTRQAFEHDVNEALSTAVDRETDMRQNAIVTRVKGWLADTTLITITADHKNRYNNTVFHIRDTHPRFAEDKNRQLSFGLSDFKERLDQINPRAKAMLIRHFGESIVKADLKKGVVYHYTELLGDSLEKVFNASHVSLAQLRRIFRSELAQKGIRSGFVLNPANKQGFYISGRVDTHMRRPYKHDYVCAALESPDRYFLRSMKWVIGSSLLLIAITISCFAYTARTLLSQEKLAAMKQAFVSNMTHELNTPIASIKITAEALKTFSYDAAKQGQYLDIIGYQAAKLSELTRQILQTNEEQHIQSAAFEAVNVADAVRQAIADMQPQVERAAADVIFEAETEAIVSGDRAQLQHVLTNLLDNALKYTDDRPVIRIRVYAAGAFVNVIVADQGIGIPITYRDQVFEPFFRVPQGDVHDVKGYGLGLSYVRQVVGRHGGTLQVSPNEPRGSVFVFTLPLR